MSTILVPLTLISVGDPCHYTPVEQRTPALDMANRNSTVSHYTSTVPFQYGTPTDVQFFMEYQTRYGSEGSYPAATLSRVAFSGSSARFEMVGDGGNATELPPDTGWFAFVVCIWTGPEAYAIAVTWNTTAFTERAFKGLTRGDVPAVWNWNGTA